MTPEDHSGGPIQCEQLGPFVDGELGAVEAAAFRRHLVQCARCQQEMHGLMQLSALAEQAREEGPVRKPELAPVWIAAADRRARPRRAAWVGVVGAVAMAAALVLALRGGRPPARMCPRCSPRSMRGRSPAGRAPPAPRSTGLRHHPRHEPVRDERARTGRAPVRGQPELARAGHAVAPPA